MMFKIKQVIKDMQESISFLTGRHYDLRGRVIKLEQKIKELECKHNFTFDRCYRSLMSYFVYYKCTECGKTTVKSWDNIAKKGQQALKLLNLVPNNWKVKGDK